MRNRSQVLIAAALSVSLVASAEAQSDEFWKNRWFWGAQAGTVLFSADGNQEAGVSAGAHWFITAGRSALYLAFDQLLFTDAATTLPGGNTVGFDRAQLLQATVYAMPSHTSLQPYLGGGFAISHVTNANPGLAATPQQQATLDSQAEEFATKAFLVLSAGIQWRWLERWVVFGQYQYMPSSDDFLITSPQHTIQGGLRFALTGSKELVSTQR